MAFRKDFRPVGTEWGEGRRERGSGSGESTRLPHPLPPECALGSNFGCDVICGLSLLLVLPFLWFFSGDSGFPLSSETNISFSKCLQLVQPCSQGLLSPLWGREMKDPGNEVAISQGQPNVRLFSL